MRDVRTCLTDQCRPALDGAMVKWSAADENEHHARDVRSSSPGLLAFIPFSAAQNAVSTEYLPVLLTGRPRYAVKICVS